MPLIDSLHVEPLKTARTDVFAVRIGRNRNGDADFETFLDPSYVLN